MPPSSLEDNNSRADQVQDRSREQATLNLSREALGPGGNNQVSFDRNLNAGTQEFLAKCPLKLTDNSNSQAKQQEQAGGRQQDVQQAAGRNGARGDGQQGDNINRAGGGQNGATGD
jgi:hypothetical protein